MFGVIPKEQFNPTICLLLLKEAHAGSVAMRAWWYWLLHILTSPRLLQAWLALADNIRGCCVVDIDRAAVIHHIDATASMPNLAIVFYTHLLEVA